MLKSITQFFAPLWSRNLAPPAFDVVEYLSSVEIRSPDNKITDIDCGEIPAHQIRRILYIHGHEVYSRNICPIRQHWRNAVCESVSDAVVPLGHLKGCTASKSDLSDFEAMRYAPKSSANVNFHIEAYRDRVEILAERVLNGTVDCAVHKGRPAKIVHQEWDDLMWLANDGGSHRTAAIWHLDREQGRERPLPSILTTYGLSQEFRHQCSEYSVWLFQCADMSDFNMISKFNESGVSLSKQMRIMTIGNLPDMCLIVKKSDPRHNAIAQSMQQAFDMSQWVNKVYKIPSLENSP